MRAIHRSAVRPVAAVALAAGSSPAATSCGRTGRPCCWSSIRMEAASGADPGTMGGFLLSDVQTLVEQQVDGETVRVPTIFNDVGQATMRIILKDSGNGAVSRRRARGTTSPSTATTSCSYRADGRNTPGVDVPYPVDGAVTATIGVDADSGAVRDGAPPGRSSNSHCDRSRISAVVSSSRRSRR